MAARNRRSMVISRARGQRPQQASASSPGWLAALRSVLGRGKCGRGMGDSPDRDERREGLGDSGHGMRMRGRQRLGGGCCAQPAAMAATNKLFGAEQQVPHMLYGAYERRSRRQGQSCPTTRTSLIAHLPRSARLETQLKPFLCPDETLFTPTCAHPLN